MASFTVRVQMHNATGEQYELLHERMFAAQYYRFVDGVNEHGVGCWLMPQAEYDHTANATVTQVREHVATIADSIMPGAWILVTEVANRAWRTEPLRLPRAA